MNQKERMIAALSLARIAICESTEYRIGHLVFKYVESCIVKSLSDTAESTPRQILDPVRLAMGASITHAPMKIVHKSAIGTPQYIEAPILTGTLTSEKLVLLLNTDEFSICITLSKAELNYIANLQKAMAAMGEQNAAG